MLSRIAELVYWIGRFTERAEDVSKMVSSYHYSATQLGSLETRSGLHDLLAAFGEHEEEERSTFRSTATWWVTAASNPTCASSQAKAFRRCSRSASVSSILAPSSAPDDIVLGDGRRAV